MFIKFRILIFVSFISVVFGGSIRGIEPEDIIARHEAQIEKINSLSFKVFRTTQIAGKDTADWWIFNYKSPDLKRAEYHCDSLNDYRILAFDGHVLWQYIPEGKRALRVDIDGLSPEEQYAELSVFLKLFIPGLRCGLQQYQRESLGYGGLETINGRESHLIETRSKGGGTGDNLKWWIDADKWFLLKSEVITPSGKLIESVEVLAQEESGDAVIPKSIKMYSVDEKGMEVVQSLKLRDIKVNMEIDDSVFQFKVPNGTNIITKGGDK